VLRTRHSIPALNVNNPKYRLAINAWRRLPVTVTNALGPFLARSIP
jgi:serine/alanine adding enzyme